MAENPILFRSRVIREIRGLLDSERYIEIPSPVVRKFPGDPDRPRVQLADGRWLRESAAFALRCNLRFADRIFEIGPMFRPDRGDETHLPEFTMLDLYASKSSLAEMLSLSRRIVQSFYRGPIEQLSFASVVEDFFGLDLVTDEDAVPRLSARISERYGLRGLSPLKLLDHFIIAEVEPLSKGRCLIVQEFPLTPEVRAKKKEGTAGIMERFEFLVDGIEIVHGYTDEPNPDLFEAAARSLDSFGPEDELMCRLLRDGLVPPESAGFGVGIERLCQVSLGTKTLRPFSSSQMFVT